MNTLGIPPAAYGIFAFGVYQKTALNAAVPSKNGRF